MTEKFLIELENSGCNKCPFLNSSDTEMVELLIGSLNDLKGSPLNMMTVVEFDRILRTLNQYVTLVGIDNENRLGVVDIDTTVDLLRTNVERLYNR